MSVGFTSASALNLRELQNNINTTRPNRPTVWKRITAIAEAVFGIVFPCFILPYLTIPISVKLVLSGISLLTAVRFMRTCARVAEAWGFRVALNQARPWLKKEIVDMLSPDTREHLVG